MRITNREAIKSGEQELIDAITADLDWGVIEEVFKRVHHLQINDNVEYKKGDIVVHKDQVAYRLEFDVTVALSVLVDREGNYLSVTSADESEPGDDQRDTRVPESPKTASRDCYQAAMSAFKTESTSKESERPADSSESGVSDDGLAAIASMAGEMAAIA
jgi:hypothetical protein